MENAYIAVDLGAESGRVMAGPASDPVVVHRFPTLNVALRGSRFWDFPYIFHEIKLGLAKAFESCGDRLVSIGVDTWGNDYGLFDDQGDLLGLPYHYRDRRTDGAMEGFFRDVMGWERLYGLTGIQRLQFNTCFQLYAHRKAKGDQLLRASRLLTVPDILNYWLSGTMACEYTEASTGALTSAETRDWAWEVIDALELPRSLFSPMVQPGSDLGRLRSDLAAELGAPPHLRVVAPACHDTGSAVAACPAEGEDWAYLSSGTWSLLGTELRRPRLDGASRDFGMTNEGGAFGTFRYLKNIMGLWLVQRLRADFGGLSYDELERAAEASPPFACILDPDDPEFFNPPSMRAAFDAAASRRGQEPPEQPGAYVRAAFEALALQYRYVLEGIGRLRGRPLRTLYVLGGGTRQRFLCRLCADICGIPVAAGPAEATALGNLLVQAVASGELSDLASGRDRIRERFGLTVYEPRPLPGLDSAWERYLSIKGERP